jgi:putative restriction endonuclease
MPPTVDVDFLRNKVRALGTWQKDGERALHKPLLLLLALGRVQRGARRLTPFRELEKPLRLLLKAYGPHRDTVHPEYPYWWLQSDELWEVSDQNELVKRSGSNTPTIKSLRKTSGGFPQAVYALLRQRGDVVRELGREGTRLRCGTKRPSPAALKLRWRDFQARCGE